MFRYSELQENIFSNVSFSLNMDSRVALVGSNGCVYLNVVTMLSHIMAFHSNFVFTRVRSAGKSTLLKIICGIHEPTEVALWTFDIYNINAVQNRVTLFVTPVCGLDNSHSIT